MRKQISNYIKAGYSCLYIVSHEEGRVSAEIAAAVKDCKGFKLHSWSVTEGIILHEADTAIAVEGSNMPDQMLTAFPKLPEKSVVVARDFHGFLGSPNPVLVRMVKDALAIGKTTNRVLIIVGCALKLPPELDKEVTVLDFGLPTRAELSAILDGIMESHESKFKGNLDEVLDAASGLTTTEAENAFSLSLIEAKEVVAHIVQREKSNTIRKNGLLEIIESKTTLDDIGGLEVLKLDLSEKRSVFTAAAKEYGLPSPRGCLFVGQPGTGKSLTATATANIFGIPLVRLEAGKLFGSLVGQSESNWRTAFATAKAIAPCVFWIDEVDGLFCGAQSSGQTDSGVTNRVIKAILQDMQSNSDGIFYVFTANDIDGLPDPLIDRLDVWSVDLPTQKEREAIWKIQISKRKRDAKKFNIVSLATSTEGFSGRQIEQVFAKAMNIAFNDKRREPNTEDCLAVAKRFVATAVTMKEAIEARRKRLANRAMPASAVEAKAAATGRKLVNN